MHNTRLLRATGIAACAVTLAACASAGDSGGGATTGPIKLGAISSLTGSATFPDVTAAAQAVFDEVNSAGGIAGREITYNVLDDKGEPAGAAQAARKLVHSDDGVVANVGSASTVDCSANAATYSRNKLVAIQGLGVDQACFNSANISPVNNGPFAGYTNLLYYASETLKLKRICAVILTFPGLTEGYQEAVGRWERISGQKALFVDTSIALSDDPTPVVLRAKQEGCQAVAFNSNPPQTVTVMKAAAAQGALTSVKWMALTVNYTASILDSFEANDSPGLLVNSEFEPWTGSTSELNQWRDLMNKHGVPQSSDAVAGYVAAKVMVTVLERIEGPINRETVTEACKSLEPFTPPLMGNAYSFGPETAHNPNQSSKFVQATPSGWRVVTPSWQRLPSS